VKQCQNQDNEEEGGVILFHPEKDEYKFVKLTNSNAGNPIARVLWTADRQEHYDLVIKQFSEGWRQHASFHTHPVFAPFPSQIDTYQLFPGFPLNYIYSPIFSSIASYSFDVKREQDDMVHWEEAFTVDLAHELIELCDKQNLTEEIYSFQ